MEVRHVLVDSAHRLRSTQTTPSNYEARIGASGAAVMSMNDAGEILKNVVGVSVVHALIPRSSDNIVDGRNSLRIAAFTRGINNNSPVAALTASVGTSLQDDLVDALQQIFFEDTGINVACVYSTDRLTLETYARVVFESDTPFVILHDGALAGTFLRPDDTAVGRARTSIVSTSSSFDSKKCTAASRLIRVDANGMLRETVSYPGGKKVYVSTEARVVMTPGLYVSEAQIFRELLRAITVAVQVIPTGFPGTESDPDATNVVEDALSSMDFGWHVRSMSRTQWSLRLSTRFAGYETLMIVGDASGLLAQLGRWRADGSSDANHHHYCIVEFASVDTTYSDGAGSLSMDDLLLPGGGGGGETARTYSVDFGFVELLPVRYVDIIVDSLPSAAYMSRTTGSTSAPSLVSARVHLVEDHVIKSSSSSLGADGRTGVSQKTFVTYRPTSLQATISRFFEPMSVKSFRIRLVDNFGRPYASHIDHSLHIMTMHLPSGMSMAQLRRSMNLFNGQQQQTQHQIHQQQQQQPSGGGHLQKKMMAQQQHPNDQQQKRSDKMEKEEEEEEKKEDWLRKYAAPAVGALAVGAVAYGAYRLASNKKNYNNTPFFSPARLK